jgi:hypothetical protein
LEERTPRKYGGALEASVRFPEKKLCSRPIVYIGK